MQVQALIAALEQLREAAKGSPSKTGGFTGQKGVFDKAIRALQPFDGASLDAAVASLTASGKPKATKPKATKPKAKAGSDPAVVQSYLQALETAVLSGYEAARKVLDRLKGDKAVKLAELRAICEAFVGSSAGIKSKSAAQGRIDKAIRSRIFNR